MPPAKISSSRANARPAPYPASKPNPPPNDKENEVPKDSASSIDQASNVKEPKETLANKTGSKSAPRDANKPDLPDSYLDIDLEEKKGEVPCYENACYCRSPLIPTPDNPTGRRHPPQTERAPQKESQDSWLKHNLQQDQTNLSKELCEVAQRHHAIETTAGHRAAGPSVKALTAFLKKSGGMDGGDSESYYYGNMFLEKMRIWTGDKKSKAREKAEQE